MIGLGVTDDEVFCTGTMLLFWVGVGLTPKSLAIKAKRLSNQFGFIAVSFAARTLVVAGANEVFLTHCGAYHIL